MLSCYGDESADETKQRVFVVAGVIGNDAQWTDLEAKWTGRNQGIPFHANDCDSDKGHYRNVPHSENKSLYRDLTIMLANSGLVGFGFAIDLIAQRKTFPNAPDFSYYKGFLEVLERMFSLATKHNETIKFTFDTRLESEHNAGLLYGQALDLSPAWKERFFPEISFVSSREYPRVQVADVMARESMKLLDNMIAPIKRPVRKSWLALSRSNRFLVDVISTEWFEDFKRKRPEMMKAGGMQEEKYWQWLRKGNRQDNMTNKLLWVYFTSKTSRVPEHTPYRSTLLRETDESL